MGDFDGHNIPLKMYGGTSFFVFLDDETLLNRSLLLMERICSFGSRLFPLQVNTIEKGSKNKNDMVAFPESVPIHFNISCSEGKFFGNKKHKIGHLVYLLCLWVVMKCATLPHLLASA